MSLLVFSTSVSAESCWPVYQAEADKINKEDGYTEEVGGQMYVSNGQIGYWPGITVAADIDNWAEDFVYAIKYGPMIMTYKPDPREDILKSLRKEIDDECSLPKENHDKLRSMLSELMDDGSFCPENKMLERPFFSRWKHYKKVVREAVKAGRFQSQCQSVAVQSDESREVKDVDSSSSPQKSSSSGTSAQ